MTYFEMAQKHLEPYAIIAKHRDDDGDDDGDIIGLLSVYRAQESDDAKEVCLGGANALGNLTPLDLRAMFGAVAQEKRHGNETEIIGLMSEMDKRAPWDRLYPDDELVRRESKELPYWDLAEFIVARLEARR